MSKATYIQRLYALMRTASFDLRNVFHIIPSLIFELFVGLH